MGKPKRKGQCSREIFFIKALALKSVACKHVGNPQMAGEESVASAQSP